MMMWSTNLLKTNQERSIKEGLKTQPATGGASPNYASDFNDFKKFIYLIYLTENDKKNIRKKILNQLTKSTKKKCPHPPLN